MVYIIDTHGTTQAVITEPIYQGSTGVNDILLLAPFPANYQITVSCILPNGIPLRNVYPMQAVVLPSELQDINKNNYTCFKATVNEMLTGLSGTVQVQFKVIQGVKKVNNVLVPRVLATYTTGFSVGLGVPTEPLTLPSDSDDINLILGYLASLNYDPITSVVYETDDAYRIADITRNEELPGVVVSFGTSQPLGIIQMFIGSPREDVNVTVLGSDGGQLTEITTSIIKGTSGTAPMVFRIYVNGDSYTEIEIAFSKPLFVERIEFFKPNDEGRYIINFRSGATADIDIAQTANALSRRVTSAQSTADAAMNVAEQARNTANNANSKATNAAAEVTSLSQRIPTTVFCDSFSEVVETVFYDGKLKSGDVIIDTTKGTVDFIVCNSDQIGSGTTLIMVEDFPNNLPTPSAGDKYMFLVDGEELSIGIIAIESGINAPQVAVDSELSPSSTNPVENKVVYQAIQSANNSINDLSSRVTSVQETAEDAKRKSESALSNLLEVRGMVPVTTFYDSFADVVRHCLYVYDLKSGDVFINTTNNTVDFIVCRMSNVPNGNEFEVITEEMLNNNMLPTPEAGNKYKFSINGEARPYGIIGIESGINAPVVIGSEEYTLVQSFTVEVEAFVERRYTGKRFKKILIVANDPASTLPRFNVMGKSETGVEWTNTVYSPVETKPILVIEGEILVRGSVSRVRAYSGLSGDAPAESFTTMGNFIKGDYYDGFKTVSPCAVGTTITVYGVEYED